MTDSNNESVWLTEILAETELMDFYSAIRQDMQISKLEHFDYVKEADLEKIGLSQPAVRRLLAAVKSRRSKQKRDRILSKFTGRSGGEKSVKDAPNDDANKDSDKVITCLISKDQLKLFERLGEGSFAKVRRGVWTRLNGKKVLYLCC